MKLQTRVGAQLTDPQQHDKQIFQVVSEHAEENARLLVQQTPLERAGSNRFDLHGGEM